jgi:hypothetical protein
MAKSLRGGDLAGAHRFKFTLIPNPISAIVRRPAAVNDPVTKS